VDLLTDPEADERKDFPFESNHEATDNPEGFTSQDDKEYAADDLSGALGTVLLIEDDDMVRSVTENMLARSGFQVLSAADGRQGLTLFRKHWRNIECVLLDCVMPGMGGQETLTHLRGIHENARVILTSGYIEPDFVDRSDGGPDAFIRKPYATSDLVSTIRSVMGS
jgi:CheY-like chemotaxis protein